VVVAGDDGVGAVPSRVGSSGLVMACRIVSANRRLGVDPRCVCRGLRRGLLGVVGRGSRTERVLGVGDRVELRGQRGGDVAVFLEVRVWAGWVFGFGSVGIQSVRWPRPGMAVFPRSGVAARSTRVFSAPVLSCLIWWWGWLCWW
jgi:hypothetical protein